MNRIRVLAAAAVALSAVPLGAGFGQPLPCVNQVSSLNSRCELWTRAFNAPTNRAGSTVTDVPAAVVADRAGRHVYLATTTTVGSARPVLTVAALNAGSGATTWVAHPHTNLTARPRVLALSPDQATI